MAATLTDDPAANAAFVAVSDGLCTAILIDNAPADIGYVHRVLAQTLGATSRSDGS